MKEGKKLKLSLYNRECQLLFSTEGQRIHTCLSHTYEEGDYLVLMAEPGSFVRIKIDPAVEAAVVYAKEDCLTYKIPFGEAKMCYPPGAFCGEYHVYEMETVSPSRETRDISTNPLDIIGDSGFYPHCTANVETRDEAVFAARNTIDGYHETNCHGIWPFTSWGDNEDPNAEITIHFGRRIKAEEIEIFLRSDFPHDNYWKSVQLRFEDGSVRKLDLEKNGDGQKFSLDGIETESVTMEKLIKCEALSSPFPSLTYWRVMGKEIGE